MSLSRIVKLNGKYRLLAKIKYTPEEPNPTTTVKMIMDSHISKVRLNSITGAWAIGVADPASIVAMLTNMSLVDTPEPFDVIRFTIMNKKPLYVLGSSIAHITDDFKLNQRPLSVLRSDVTKSVSANGYSKLLGFNEE